MKRAATVIWRHSKPESKQNLWTVIALKKLGCQRFLDGLAKAIEVLGFKSDKGTIIPAAFAESDIMVRKALCPDHNASVLIKNRTAWCRRWNRQCPHLGFYHHEQGWVACKAGAK